jgi:tetratricopeptide (TPR) repeat protein
MRRALILSLVVPLLLASPAAHADGDATAQAKQAFTAAVQAYREARYKDAIDLFRKAHALDPHADLIFNVGQAYEKLGDVANALRSYREYLRLEPQARDRAAVDASIRNLEARLRDRGVQQVTVLSTPPGAVLVLDGKVTGETPWTGEIATGHHTALVRATGYAEATTEFSLSDRAVDLDFALGQNGKTVVVREPTGPDKPKDGPPPLPPDAPKRGVAPWTFAALGVGVAGLGAALGLEMARRSAESTATTDHTQIGYQNALSNMSTFQTASRVLVGVGAAATAAGGVLLVLDLRRPAAPPVKAGLGCVAGFCGPLVTGRF